MGKENSYSLPPMQCPFPISGQSLWHPHPAFDFLEKGTNHGFTSLSLTTKLATWVHCGLTKTWFSTASWQIIIVKSHEMIFCWEILHFKAILEITLIQTQWLSNPWWLRMNNHRIPCQASKYLLIFKNSNYFTVLYIGLHHFFIFSIYTTRSLKDVKMCNT